MLLIEGDVMGRSKEFEENVVLQKAMELFWEQGYEKTSLNDLVEHMGIHRRSLYDTFGDKIDIHGIYLYFLNDKIFDNENDNSNVIYFEYLKYKFLFMGDASSNVEDYIMSKYNLSDITFFKVGHHGSKTSSSKDFIDCITPKISLISLGRGNIYGHPNEEVLENLNNSKIYRTDLDGSINIKINKSKVRVRTAIKREGE